MLLYDEGGSYLTALNVEEWNRLWAYERDYGVRQAALYASYGTWPENYCLTGFSEGGVGDTPLNAVADHHRGAGLRLPEDATRRSRSRSRTCTAPAITAGCSAEPVLTNGDDVLGVRTTSPDGRERLALTFTSNQYLLQTHLLVYGVFRWASRGPVPRRAAALPQRRRRRLVQLRRPLLPGRPRRVRPGLPGLRARRVQPGTSGRPRCAPSTRRPSASPSAWRSTARTPIRRPAATCSPGRRNRHADRDEQVPGRRLPVDQPHADPPGGQLHRLRDHRRGDHRQPVGRPPRWACRCPTTC